MADIDAPESSSAELSVLNICTKTSGRCTVCTDKSGAIEMDMLQLEELGLSSRAAITDETLPRFPRRQFDLDVSRLEMMMDLNEVENDSLHCFPDEAG